MTLAQASVLPVRTRSPIKPAYRFLRITMHGRAADTGLGNGLFVYRSLRITFDYGPAPGVCVGGNAPAQKISLVTTALTGFQAKVATPIISGCFATGVVLGTNPGSTGWINDGIFARWLDVPADLDLQVGTLTPAGGYLAPTGDGGVSGDRLPLVNDISVHKYTGQRGRSWAGKSWKMPCVPLTFASGDDVTTAAKTAWEAVKAGLYSPITDGTSTLYPILVSQRNSELEENPTVVSWAPLILPGTDPITGTANPLINYTIGTTRRRKEKHGLTF